MLVTTQELSDFSKVYPENDNLQIIYINSANQIIDDYVGYSVREKYPASQLPDIFKLVCLEIATLIQAEEGTNIGVNTSNEVGVQRTFLNVVDYTKYLQRLSAYREV